MSKIGKKNILIPKDSSIKIEGADLTISGPKGTKKLTINDKNVGAGRSRNIGIEQSKGTLLAFIDADDMWSKNKLDEQIKFMQDQAISFCHTSYKIINEKGDFVSLRKARNFMTVNDLIKSCDVGLSTVLIEKEAIGLNKFPELKTKLPLKLKNFKKSGNEIILNYRF